MGADLSIHMAGAGRASLLLLAGPYIRTLRLNTSVARLDRNHRATNVGHSALASKHILQAGSCKNSGTHVLLIFYMEISILQRAHLYTFNVFNYGLCASFNLKHKSFTVLFCQLCPSMSHMRLRNV